MKFMNKLRDKLSPRDKALFKLVLWSVLIVWMVFWFAFSLTIASRLAEMGPIWFGINTWGRIMTWVAPIWVVFTSLLIIILIARYAGKKMGRKKKED